jgi:nucleotide-binding universal stress UspA family protein
VKTIVVGVDGSEQATRALQWAADDARVHGASLRIVSAWRDPVPVGDVGGMGMVGPDVTDEIETAAHRQLEQQLAQVDVSGLEVERLVVHRQPVDALLEAAKGADLLVLGARGHGGLTTLLVGSVSDDCVHRAPCPVVIVR